VNDVTKLDDLILAGIDPALHRAARSALRPTILVMTVSTTAKVAVAGLILAFASSQVAIALDDIERFQFSAGFDSDRRHMIDPIGGERDENGNLVRVDSLSSDGGKSSKCGLLSSAIGNLLSVVVDGNNNTVVVNSTQTNTGDITATSSLNGRIQLPCF
jgi:holdfast attachment protein HfaA